MVSRAPSRMFRSLRIRNYRIWAAGAVVSNVGTWMQRTAQDWLVLTELTHRNAAAVGVVTALQFGPQLLLLPWTGAAADRFDRRKLVLATQATMCALALSLGLLTVTGVVRLWHVEVFAFLLGCAAAFDAPARTTFVGELVGETDLPNAVALNSTSFNAARLVGPACAGSLIAAVGCGPVFLLNALSYIGVIASLLVLRVRDLHRGPRRPNGPGALAEGFRYVRGRSDLMVVMALMFIIGTFGVNYALFISTMSVSVFHAGAGGFGGLMSIMAVGSVAGALMAARREKPGLGLMVAATGVFGAALALAAVMPVWWLFGAALVLVGLCGQTSSTSAMGLVQISTEPGMRGRVVALLLAVALGGTPIGAPTVGWIADHLGPRWAMGASATAVLAAAGFGWLWLRGARGGSSASDAAAIAEDANGISTRTHVAS